MTINLTAEKRDILGKALEKSREDGKLPIVAYGAKKESANYFVDVKAFKKALEQAGESTVVSLQTPDGELDTLIHAIDNHPMSGEPIHADFLIIDKNKPIEVEVPFEFTGEAPAEKAGLMIVKVMHELEIEALPKDLPHEIMVDISTLVDLESRITVADLKLPAGVTAKVEGTEVVASVTEAGEEVKEEEVPVDLTAIEVEKKGKTDEEGAEGGETAPAEGEKK